MAKHNVKFNLTEVQLTPEGFQYTTVDMWKKFFRHVVDFENDYFDNMVDKKIIEYNGDEMKDKDEDDLLDDDDRHLTDMALQLS